MDLENQCLATIIIMIDLRPESSMDAKTSGWDLEDYIDYLQLSPDKIVVNHKVILQRG